ncbi:GNAT family N-acetyltransferase [Pseudomonas fluorescens]|uniref:GNAT family N-acetyltransferase n=1 Tax=Pseudomonas fluorescens TaxID=294 RepID=UPI00190358A5|nr:GNAT family N-acetyltransferase [Pseudomonas fluorescens]MBD8091639.1 GNAT family N-acetyltransferase [Pseudomonas fluorescens]MBD8716237.1 GNAT family N-acetyltransferase [Pseudomonas fluorescens]
MHVNAACDLPTLYGKTEEHFFAAVCPTHRRYGDGINAYFSDEYFSPFNLLFIRVGSTLLDNALAAPLGLIRRTTQAIRVVIHEAQVEALGEVFLAHGFKPVEKTTAMVGDLTGLAPWPGESGVQIQLTRNMHDWAEPFGSAFMRQPEEVARYQARHQRALDAGQALYHFTLSEEGQVRSSLVLSLCDGEARLSDIGTLMGLRGRGYASRLIHAALLHASSLGALRCFLEASQGALGLYRHLGFEPLYECQAFTRDAIADA